MEELLTPSGQSQEPGLPFRQQNLALVVLLNLAFSIPIKEMNLKKAPVKQVIGRLEMML